MAGGGPYDAPGFTDRALAAGRHREITGGWWEETGRLQLALLREAGLVPGDRLLDIGCGALRLGRLAVPFLDPGHYWGTDASAALMRRGWEVELDPAAQARLPPAQLVEDADFALPGVSAGIDMAMIWGVFPHLPPPAIPRAMAALHRFDRLRAVLFTVFLPAEPVGGRPATHPDRAPWHVTEGFLHAVAAAAGLALTLDRRRLPRGQVLAVARPV